MMNLNEEHLSEGYSNKKRLPEISKVSDLAGFLCTISPADQEAARRCEAHWDGIGKPLKGLGEMEHLLERIAGITGTPDVSLDRREIVVFCADNGIVEEGVTQTGDEVTAIVAENMAKGCASVNLMAQAAGADVLPVDIGMRHEVLHPNMRQCAVARGTKNFTKTAAMTEQECLQAIFTGIHLAKERKEAGIEISGVGEMGIGNTTTSGAIAAALLNKDADLVSGRGAGLSDEGLRKKREVIRKGLRLHGLMSETLPKYGMHRDALGSESHASVFGILLSHGEDGAPRNLENTDGDPATENPVSRYETKQDDAFCLVSAFKTLASVGGFDLAGMVGYYFGCAAYRLPVVLDGAISLAAALCACEMEKQLTGRKNSYVADALIPSHLGREPVCGMICERLGLRPVIHADLALGEGTGDALLFAMLDPVLAVYRENRTFEDIHVSAYEKMTL
ncbi:MAG: nicotinate-nucleotide--dimethylbenzimidazole phosphoribosyltransferase [Lachnospiraceae bacterium]|nr:nicotinate-nucleotide--dimethylbenzimidazole phosphoribosyltransferase [Lachnospiraceae bacterium]